MKLIPLSQIGKYKGTFFAQVDDDDYDFLNQWNWHVQRGKYHNYAGRSVRNGEKQTAVPMHRILMKVTDKKLFVDHIDMDGLNNQKHNLRIATKSENNRNTQSRKNGTSKYLGVSWSIKKRKKRVYTSWVAQIQHNNKNMRLGYFKSEIDAAIAYDKAAKKFHGDFANLNFK